MLAPKVSYLMVFVSDMDRSVAFYRDLLGLPLRFQSPEWTEFATEGTTLALHGGGGEPVERSKSAGTVEFGWHVEDLDATCAALKARGVRFVIEPTDRGEEGIRLAAFLDPDGCAISLAQSTRS